MRRPPIVTEPVEVFSSGLSSSGLASLDLASSGFASGLMAGAGAGAARANGGRVHARAARMASGQEIFGMTARSWPRPPALSPSGSQNSLQIQKCWATWVLYQEDRTIRTAAVVRISHRGRTRMHITTRLHGANRNPELAWSLRRALPWLGA